MTLFITEIYYYLFLVAKLFYNFHLIVLKLICPSLLYLKETIKIFKKIPLTNSKYVLTKPKMLQKKFHRRHKRGKGKENERKLLLKGIGE